MTLSPANCNKPREFIERYEAIFSAKVPMRLLEIGVQNGDSLRMWANAFPDAEVVGLDIKLLGGHFPPNVRLVHGNQADTKLLHELGRFDFVVDDGSHMTKDQQTTFETLFPLLSTGGIYVIEDLEVNREKEFKNTPLSTTEYFSELLAPVLVQNAWQPGFTQQQIKSITFADNMLIIEKL